jgi:hypothetical protein
MRPGSAPALLRIAGAAAAGAVVYVSVLWLLTGDATPGLDETSIIWGLLVVAFVVAVAVSSNA